MRILQILPFFLLSGLASGQVDCTECLRNMDALIEKKRQLEVDRDFYKREMEKLEQRPEKVVVKTKYVKIADTDKINDLEERISYLVLDSVRAAGILTRQDQRELELIKQTEMLKIQRIKDSLTIDSLQLSINSMLKHLGNKIDERKRSVYYAGSVYDYLQVFEFVEFFRDARGQYGISPLGKRKLRWISQLILLELGPKSKSKLKLTVQLPVSIQPHHHSYVGDRELRAKVQNYLRSIGCPDDRIAVNTYVEKSSLVYPRVVFSIQAK